ncbi:MAG: PQQ-binding-like beta-propeller repeat protein [Armatimonadetes bacterium]|nr:PQQ-binding-like beta-propeller repeat protein [Armatimonadota bacterium]
MSTRVARLHETLASTSVVVSAGGRLFCIEDEAPTASILLPPQWVLIARDAFNGIALWKRPLSSWESHLRSFRSGPPELSRRLVAAGERAYVTLGCSAPATALDAATGETVTTYAGTEGAEEILWAPSVGSDRADRSDRSVLYVVASDSASAPRTLLAFDAVTGRALWRQQGAGPLPMSLAVSGGHVCYLGSQALGCLDASTGQPRWQTPREVAGAPFGPRPGFSAPTVVLSEDVVLCADRDLNQDSNLNATTGKPIAQWLATAGAAGVLTAYSAETGKELWSCPCAEAYHAPTDVFVIDGLV